MKQKTKESLIIIGDKSLDFLIELAGGFLAFEGANHFLGDKIYFQLPAATTGFNLSGYVTKYVRHQFVDSDKYKKPEFRDDVVDPLIAWTGISVLINYLK